VDDQTGLSTTTKKNMSKVHLTWGTSNWKKKMSEVEGKKRKRTQALSFM